MDEYTTWRKEITRVMEIHKESWDDVIHIALERNSWEDSGPANLDREFYPGYGGPEGDYFTIWTKERIYFPGCYDGLEWVSSIPRNPCDKAMKHVGSW